MLRTLPYSRRLLQREPQLLYLKTLFKSCTCCGSVCGPVPSVLQRCVRREAPDLWAARPGRKRLRTGHSPVPSRGSAQLGKVKAQPVLTCALASGLTWLWQGQARQPWWAARRTRASCTACASAAAQCWRQAKPRGWPCGEHSVLLRVRAEHHACLPSCNAAVRYWCEYICVLPRPSPCRQCRYIHSGLKLSAAEAERVRCAYLVCEVYVRCSLKLLLARMSGAPCKFVFMCGAMFLAKCCASACSAWHYGLGIIASILLASQALQVIPRGCCSPKQPQCPDYAV